MYLPTCLLSYITKNGFFNPDFIQKLAVNCDFEQVDYLNTLNTQRLATFIRYIVLYIGCTLHYFILNVVN